MPRQEVEQKHEEIDKPIEKQEIHYEEPVVIPQEEIKVHSHPAPTIPPVLSSYEHQVPLTFPQEELKKDSRLDGVTYLLVIITNGLARR